MAAVLGLPCLVLPACSSGGEEDRPVCDEPIAQALWVAVSVARPQIADLPVTLADANVIDARFDFRDDCSYSLTSLNGGPDITSEYAIESNGDLSVLVPTDSGTLLYRGAYGLEGDTGNMFLTDRVGTGIGLYLGSPRVIGDPISGADLAGDFHVFAMQLVLDTDPPVPTADAVGRALAGSMTLAADGSVVGTVTESQGATRIAAGAGGVVSAADGRFDFRFDVTSGAIIPYELAGVGGGSADLVFGVDPDSNTVANDGVGLFAMMRERDPADYDRAELYGTYRLGLWTLFISPSAPGTDAALGDLELRDDGSFRIEAVSNTGADFVYEGTWTAEADGSLEFRVSGTTESWAGAFDQGYDTILLLDPFKEDRGTNRQIELNLGMALRPVPSSSN